MTKPVHIFINGQELLGWTSMSLQRSKDRMTGVLNVDIFFNYMPSAPVLVTATRGQEILVYIGGHLAFTGKVDKRNGKSVQARDERGRFTRGTVGDDVSGEISSSISTDAYNVTLTARGKTKYLIDSSHQHPTTNMLKPTNRQAFAKLVEPWNIGLDWQASEFEIDKIRFRDGARVVDECHRLATEHAHFIYETRDGKLRITDGTGNTFGEPLILGTNILSFSSEQAEDQAKSVIKVKGQRTEKEIWGEQALIETVKEVMDDWVGAEVPIIVQHYGNATPEALERRATFEANKRSSASKRVTIDVFHVQTTTGEPWDIGQLHYIEVPPEGVFDVMECVELTYNVQNDNTIKTSLTFSPPPTGAISGGTELLATLPQLTDELVNYGPGRRAAAGVTFGPGQFPSPWTGPVLSVLPFKPLADVATAGITLFSSLVESIDQPLMTLPAGYRSEDEDD